MDVPSAEDYQDLDSNLFKTPKSVLFNCLQGKATLGSKYEEIRPMQFRCTLTYESIQRTETVQGEGKRKVCLQSEQT